MESEQKWLSLKLSSIRQSFDIAIFESVLIARLFLMCFVKNKKGLLNFNQNRSSMKQLIFLALLLGFSACQRTGPTTTQQLGEVHFEVSGSDEAKPVFKEGLMLLHSFEFKDAAEKFRKAQEIDPDFAMAYWGEAMTENHPLWREQEFDKAKEILDKLGATEEERRAKFKTDLEKDFHDAISTLYGEGTKKERDKAYSLFMKKLDDKYPDNHEVTAFYALSVLGAAEGKRDYETYGRAARIAQSVIDENPNHPGALHYLIHSYDDPENAPKALDAANSYSKVAPEANHALHMPSHIYVALGMWDEVISSNKAAFAASEKRKARKDLDNDALDYHSLKWLMYGHLQKKEFAKAKALVQDMEGYCYELDSHRAVSHNVMMKAAYFTETGDWDDELVLDTIDYSELPVQIFGAHSYMKGMLALHQNDMDGLQTIIDHLHENIKEASNEITSGTAAMCSGSYSRRRPVQSHVDRATVMEKELLALLNIRQGNIETAEILMKEALVLEESVTFSYGPPEIVKPSHELYGEFLIEQNRHEEAKAQFEKVLERAPKRLIALEAMQSIEKVI